MIGRISVLTVLFLIAVAVDAGSLRFYGDVRTNVNRVNVRLDPHVPADVGAGDFTIEFWMKANGADVRSTGSCSSGAESWINASIVLDRALWNSTGWGSWGLSIFRSGGGGRVSFGLWKGGSFGTGLCGTRNVADGQWHHVALTRAATGALRLYVDGVLDGQATGPSGDVSYRNGQASSVPGYIQLNVENYLGIGAEKYDADPVRYPSFNGLLDEIRFSTVIRYTGAFTVPAQPFALDAQTAALYHFDESAGDVVSDAVGSSSGVRRYGGQTNPGPQWVADSPFAGAPPPPPPPPAPVWRSLAGALFARDGNGNLGARIVTGGVPTAVAAGLACDANDIATDPASGASYMRVTGAAFCDHGLGVGQQATGYARCQQQ